jgi:hypothetical protein
MGMKTRSTIPPPPQSGTQLHAALDADALDGILEEIRAHRAHPERYQVLARYEIGGLALDVARCGDAVGPNVVARIAAAMGVSRSAIYRYAAVASCFSKAEVEAACDRAATAGRSLKWTHLRVLSGEPCARKRAALLERVASEGMSVRALVAAVRGPRRASLERLRELTHALLDESRQWVRAVSAPTDGGARAHDAELLAQLVALHRTLHAASARHLRAFGRARDVSPGKSPHWDEGASRDDGSRLHVTAETSLEDVEGRS